MDVSLYISELLELHGEVSVPGLGKLVQARVSGYYNAAEFKFYPPHNEIKFESDTNADGKLLTQYIADKKNISLESSGYFTEKYITNLKEEALTNEVPVANIGWFYANNGRIAFKAVNKITNDPVFYGYPAVRANKLLSQNATSTPASASTPPPAQPAYSIPTPEPEPLAAPTHTLVPERFADTIEEREQEEEELFYEEPRTSRLLRVWLILISCILILLIIAFGLYKFKPSAFEKLDKLREYYFKQKTASGKLEEAHKVKIDTAVAAAPDTSVRIDSAVKADTTIKKITPTGSVTDKIKKTEVTKTTVVTTPPVSKPTTAPVNRAPMAPVAVPKVTAPRIRKYGIIVYTAKTMDEANRVINNYKANGIDVQIVPGKKAPRITITAGSYNTLDEAQIAFTKLIESRKIDKDSYPIEIK